MVEHAGEEHVEKGRAKDTALLDTVAGFEGLRHLSSGQHLPGRVVMNVSDEVDEFVWAPELWQDNPEGFPVDRVEGLGEVNKGSIVQSMQVHVFFKAFLLHLPHDEDHGNCTAVWASSALFFWVGCLRRLGKQDNWMPGTFPAMERRKIPL